MAKMVFDFHIALSPDKISELKATNGEVAILPFGGKVESELFTGTILPGAADVQIQNASGIRHMCARYMFQGKDHTGAECKLFVDNNGYFEPKKGGVAMPFYTCPTFMTDSAALAPYLEAAHFRAEGHMKEDGLHIMVFDTHQD